jgi:hypothetical protein
MRQAKDAGRVIMSEVKGAQEGFEQRIIWPVSIANYEGIVSCIDDSKIQYRRADNNRTVTVHLTKSEISMFPLVAKDDAVIRNQVLAATVQIARSVPCASIAGEEHYIKLLGSVDLSERYAAAKALAFFQTEKVIKALLKKVEQQEEHIYVKLEAAASLARFNAEDGWKFINKCLQDDYLQNRLVPV